MSGNKSGNGVKVAVTAGVKAANAVCSQAKRGGPDAGLTAQHVAEHGVTRLPEGAARGLTEMERDDWRQGARPASALNLPPADAGRPAPEDVRGQASAAPATGRGAMARGLDPRPGGGPRDIEDLLVWAYRTQKVAATSSGGGGGDSLNVLASVMALGCRVDTSGIGAASAACSRPCDPDAELIHEAVTLALTGFDGKLVMLHAERGTRPPTDVGPPVKLKAVPNAWDRPTVWTWQDLKQRGLANRGRKEAAWCPLRRVDLTGFVRTRREEYGRWWQALAAAREWLETQAGQGKGLHRFTATGPAAPTVEALWPAHPGDLVLTGENPLTQ